MLKYFVYYFYRILTSLWRIRLVIDPEVQALMNQKAPLVLAHWHGDELAVLHLVRVLRLATMTSTSKDGETIDFVIRKLGGSTSRGSSTRGGVRALVGLVRMCRNGQIASVAVDGPRGPIYEPKAGVFELSRLAGAKIASVGVHATHKWILKKSWNKIYLPLPFSKVSIFFGFPMPIVSEDDDPKSPELALQLKLRLGAAKQQASKNIAAT